MKQTIALYQLRPYPVFNPAGRKLNAHGRWAWLHRLLWKTLERFGAIEDHFEETTAYRRVVIDEQRIIDAVGRTLDGLYARGEKPKEILMGPQKFSELMQTRDLWDYMDPVSFSMKDRRLLGMPVHVLPWMEGLLVR